MQSRNIYDFRQRLKKLAIRKFSERFLFINLMLQNTYACDGNVSCMKSNEASKALYLI